MTIFSVFVISPSGKVNSKSSLFVANCKPKVEVEHILALQGYTFQPCPS